MLTDQSQALAWASMHITSHHWNTHRRCGLCFRESRDIIYFLIPICFTTINSQVHIFIIITPLIHTDKSIFLFFFFFCVVNIKFTMLTNFKCTVLLCIYTLLWKRSQKIFHCAKLKLQTITQLFFSFLMAITILCFYESILPTSYKWNHFFVTGLFQLA